MEIPAASQERHGTALVVLAMPIVCATLLTKFAIPPFGAQGIGISVMVMLLAIAWGVLAGCMRVDPVRLALFCIITGTLGVIPLLRGAPFSVNSVTLFAALHLPLAFSVAAGRHSERRAVSFFLNVSLVLACLGIAQYFLQFLVDARYLFPIENFVPESYVVQLFNKQAELGYSGVFRSNGVFLLEPSYFAQLLAVAIVVELCTLGRLRRLPFYALGLLLAHSGTGLIVLAASLPLFVISRKRMDLLLPGLLLVAVLFVFRDYLFLGRLFGRVEEFGSTESSGFARFIGGFYVLNEFVWKDPWLTLFGAGAGSFHDHAMRSAYEAAEMPLFKTLFEFGLVGTATYFGFLVYCFFSSPLPKLIGFTLLVCLLLNGLYVPFAYAIALSLLVWPHADAEPVTLVHPRQPVPPRQAAGFRESLLRGQS